MSYHGDCPGTAVCAGRVVEGAGGLWSGAGRRKRELIEQVLLCATFEIRVCGASQERHLPHRFLTHGNLQAR